MFDNVSETSTADALVYLLCAVLAVSLVVIAFLIYTMKKKESGCYNGNKRYKWFFIQHYNIKATPSLFIVNYILFVSKSSCCCRAENQWWSKKSTGEEFK